MKHLKTWRLFENETFYSSKEIIKYIKDISGGPETDIPDYYISLIKKESPKFVLRRLNIEDLLKNDKSLEEYVMSGEDRYEDSEYQPSYEEIYDPIVIFKGEVIDGYNRTGSLYRLGEKDIDAYISV